MKKNVCAMVGGILCLASMLMSYLSFKQLGITLFSIKWSTAAQYLNHNLYFIPVIGVLMLVSGFFKKKTVALIAALAAVGMVVYYPIVASNLVGMDSMERLLTEGPQMLKLLSNSLNLNLETSEISTETALEILDFVKSAQQIGKGYGYFCTGTLLSVIGLFVPLKTEAKKVNAAASTASSDNSSIF